MVGVDLEDRLSWWSVTHVAATDAGLMAAVDAFNYTDVPSVLSTEQPTNASEALCLADPDCACALAFLENTRFVIQRILVPIVTIVGVLGNGATTVVLSRPRMRSSTNTYLCALAVSDLLYLLFMFSMSLSHYPGIKRPAYLPYWQYRPYGFWFTDATSSSSIWLTVSFTVERYIAVCHPLRGKVLCTEARARKVTLLVCLACLLATASTPYEWLVQEKDGELSLTESALGRDGTYIKLFYWFSSVTFVFLPLLLLGVFNSFLVLAVHRSRRQRNRLTQRQATSPDKASRGRRREPRKIRSFCGWRSKSVEPSDSNQRQENRITVTLIAVVVLFMVCQTPTALMLLYTVFCNIKPGSADDKRRLGVNNIFNFLMAIHSACNFLLYCALSDKYRRTFALTFLPRSWFCKLYGNSTSSACGVVTSTGGTNYTSVPLHSRASSVNGIKRQPSSYTATHDLDTEAEL